MLFDEAKLAAEVLKTASASECNKILDTMKMNRTKLEKWESSCQDVIYQGNYAKVTFQCIYCCITNFVLCYISKQLATSSILLQLSSNHSKFPLCKVIWCRYKWPNMSRHLLLTLEVMVLVEPQRLWVKAYKTRKYRMPQLQSHDA